MRRRRLLTLAGGAAAVWPSATSAQAKVPTIGVLVRASAGWNAFWQEFRGSMHALGYVEGQNIRYELRTDEGDIDRLRELAADLVRLKVDVIVTWYTPATTAAKLETRDIPIVCAICGDMVATGLVKSLARPGGNVTGIGGVGAELSAKCVQLMRELLPAARRFVVLVNMRDPFSGPFLARVLQAGEATQTRIEPIRVHSDAEFLAAFETMAGQRPDALIVQPSLPAGRAAELALGSRIPAACAVRAFAQFGGLLAYSDTEAEAYRLAAVDVDKILRGTRPADLPVEQPNTFTLTINLKTAKALAIKIPATVLARADELIQ